jgi:hypothetical protein
VPPQCLAGLQLRYRESKQRRMSNMFFEITLKYQKMEKLKLKV